MSSLRKPALGPIIGHTTDCSCRIWVAASGPDHCLEKESEDKRSIGVIGVMKQDDPGRLEPDQIYYFRLKREYGRTGSFHLGLDSGLFDDRGNARPKAVRLEPGRKYRVRLATLSLDDSFHNDYEVTDAELARRLPAPQVWASVLEEKPDAFVEAEFKTFPPLPADGRPNTKISFLLGSCRYPGILWKRKESDRIFGPMLRKHRDEIQFNLMVGDQIYADMFSRHIPIGLADTYHEFEERYRTAFGSRNMRALLRNIPTYMTLDDHEIEDNWTQDRIKKERGKRVLFNLAIDAYMRYQWSHGPRSWNNSYLDSDKRNLSDADDCLHNPHTALLYYDFICAGYPFFVLDTRTQRYQEDASGLEDNHLLGRPSQHPSEPGQLDRLSHWLQYQQEKRGNTPKFIVSSSVFVPNTVKSTRKGYRNKEDSDSWPAFPNTRRAILDCIVRHHIENVVFLSGDVHCSNVAQMTFSEGPSNTLKAYCITSSAFYWPFPFADGDPADYVHDSKKENTRDSFELSEGLGKMDYTAWGFTQADNYCRVTVDAEGSTLDVQLFDQRGNPIKTRKQSGEVNRRAQKLALVEW